MSVHNQGFAVPEAQEIKDKYPKFFRAIKGHLMGGIELPEDFEKMVPEGVLASSNTLVELMLTTSSFRDMYDFFDSKGLRVEVFSTVNGFNGMIIRVNSNEAPIEHEVDDTKHRIEAELAAFKTAIAYYEQL